MTQEIQHQTPRESIEHLPAQTLLHLARNESATQEFRIAAVELMVDNGFSEANHPELALLAQEVRRRSDTKAEVTAIVESATEESLDKNDANGVIDGAKFFKADDLESTENRKFDWKAFAKLRKASDDTGPFKASVTTATMQTEG